MAETNRKSVIITFKAKDKRDDKKKDKVQIVTSEISSKVSFYESESVTSGAALARNLAPEEVGFDINQYEAPIVTASLTDKEIKAIKGNPNVATVEDDGPVYALDIIPRVESLIVEGQPTVLAETIPIGVSQVKAPPAWDSSRGKGIRVAVLDTGIDGMHPDLSANYKGGVSFVPGEGPADGNSHGTHCAGTIAAAINGVGVVGVAPAASLYAVKVLSNSGSGNWSWLIAGINWCIANKMRILSMSLGGGSAPSALQTMCNTAFSNGLLLIAAAGNSGPPPAGSPTSVGFPGRYKNVIAVSAIDSANVIASFSSRGPEVEICAPGVNVLSTIPGGGYGTKSGTSMACPHVSGAAAVAWGSHRFANNVTIWNLLGSTAFNLGPPGWDPNYGYGRVDVDLAASALGLPPAVPLRP
jgi:subtilisin